jgi:hypothetical protein
MSLHVMLQVTLTLVLTIECIDLWVGQFGEGSIIIIITLNSVDALMQFGLCFICWTLGSSRELRKYNLAVINRSERLEPEEPET